MTAHLPILCLFLAIAAAADIAQRRVPNVVVAPLAAAGIAAQWASGGAGSAGNGVLAGSAVIAILVIPWARGAIGGGDVKLAASVAIWLGLGSLLPFLLYAGAAGVPVALTARLAHRLELRRLARTVSTAGEAVLPPQETVPVAVAVALGALAALWGKP